MIAMLLTGVILVAFGIFVTMLARLLVTWKATLVGSYPPLLRRVHSVLFFGIDATRVSAGPVLLQRIVGLSMVVVGILMLLVVAFFR